MQRSTALFSLVLLAACDPTSNGSGGTGDASSGSSGATGSSGMSGAGGGASSSASSSGSSSATGGAGGGGGVSSSASSSGSSSGAGTGGGGTGLSVAWTKIISSSPNATYPLDLQASAISAETPNRVFVGATLRGSYVFAGVGFSVDTFLVYDLAVVLALDGAGNEVSNLQFASNGGIGYSPHAMTTDAAGNLFVGGAGSGTNATHNCHLQKYGASPWHAGLGGFSGGVSEAGVVRIEVDAAGNPLAHLFVTPPGLDYGAGLQSGYLLNKRDGATGSLVWSKAAPEGLMRRDASGNLLFLGGSPLTLTKLDTNGATLAVKSYLGAPTSVSFTTGSSGSLITALLKGTVDFGCGPVTSAGSGDDLLVVKLDAAGTCVYSRRFDAAGFPYYGTLAIALTSAGDAVIIASNTSPVDLGGGPVPAGQFVLKLDPAGAFVSTWSMAAVPSGAAIDDSGAVYFVSSASTFDVGTGPLLANTKGMAIAKLVP